MILMLAFVLLPVFVQVPKEPPYDSMSFFGLKTPSLCFSKTWLDVDCITCGMSRCLSLMAHGRVMEAFQVHRIGPMLYLCMLAEAIFRGLVLVKGPSWVKDPVPRLHLILWVSIIAAMIFYWVFKMFAG